MWFGAERREAAIAQPRLCFTKAAGKHLKKSFVNYRK